MNPAFVSGVKRVLLGAAAALAVLGLVEVTHTISAAEVEALGARIARVIWILLMLVSLIALGIVLSHLTPKKEY